MVESAFFTLNTRLQDGIAHNLGWASLRPVQELTINAVLCGNNCVVLAPTAGGKTEAAFFPILDLIYKEQRKPVSVLYISPLRALLNNQEPRLKRLAQIVGLDAFKWHGDVPQTARRRFLAEPCHLLMITPESLEVIMMSPMIDKARLFSSLRFTVIDEIHNFASGDRGAHLLAVLERIKRYTENDIQRIGLSATVGNPTITAAWMQGSSRRPSVVVDPPEAPASRLIRIDIYDDDGELAQKVAPRVVGRKTLFFVEGRRLAEGVKQALADVSTISYVHHSSVGRELREEVEQSFTYGHENQCIVCTSTMELGIDVGDLDAVLQLDAPTTVSSFLQRLGRTGRRSETQAEMNFYCGDEIALLRAVALVNLARKKWVEPVIPSQRAFHVLIHQVLAQALQHYGATRSQLWELCQTATPFQNIQYDEFDQILTHLIYEDILHQADGLMVMGKAGEKRYGKKNFLELYSVFETPEEIKVLTTNNRLVGSLQSWFIEQVYQSESFIFTLAGQAWKVQYLDFEAAIMYVVPAPKGSIPRWGGAGALLSREVVEEMLAILRADEVYPFVTHKAQSQLERMRSHWKDIVWDHHPTLDVHGREWVMYTFAGDRINLLLARSISMELGCEVNGDSFSLRIKPPTHVPLAEHEILATIKSIQTPDYFSQERIMILARSLPKSRLSKFQTLLPPEIEAKFIAERLFDVDGLLGWLDEQKLQW
ncbi:MAG: DEAD/DEAH box helicase [Anaerolineales bacterium]|nr:DEAD/DEAH box helicase [Anaerolineales bacterium]